MTSILIIPLAFIAFGAVFYVYVRIKRVANGIVAISVNEFHNSVTELVKAGDAVPDEMLAALRLMNDTGFSKGSNWHLRRLLRLERKGLLRKRTSVDWHKIVGKLKPEVADPFNRAVVAWTNIMIGRNPFLGALIAFEILRWQVKLGQVPRREDGEALRVLPELCAQ